MSSDEAVEWVEKNYDDLVRRFVEETYENEFDDFCAKEYAESLGEGEEPEVEGVA